MKNIFYKVLPVCILTLFLAGCQDDIMYNPLPEAVPLEMTVNTKTVVMGEHLKVNFIASTDKDGNVMSPEEDFDIYFTARVDGKDVSDLFETFTEVVTFPKGEKQIQVDFLVKSSGLEGVQNVELTAFSRGYSILNAGQIIKVSDYHRIVLSVDNNDNKVVMEGDQFILVAKVDKPSSVPIMIKLTPKIPGRFASLPNFLTIPAGSNISKSGKITLVTDGIEAGDLDVLIEAESNAIDHPMSEKVLTILALDAEGVNPDLYEMIYPQDQMFVSPANKDNAWFAGKSIKEMVTDDVHPNASLAAEGWKFLTASELHYIAGLYTPGNPHNILNADNGFNGDAIIGVNFEGLSSLAFDSQLCSHVDDEGKLTLWARKEAGKYKIGGQVIAKANPKFWGYNYILIYPGMRIEFKVRLGGIRTGFAPTISLKDQTSQTNWGTRSINILKNENGTEIIQSVIGGAAVANAPANETILRKTNMPKADTWNVYWVEWVEDGTIKLGINSLTTLIVNPDDMISWNYKYTKAETKDGQGANVPVTGKLGLFLSLRMTPASGVGGLASGWDAALAAEGTAPRMEIDWIRYYTNKNYVRASGEDPVVGAKAYY